jgi:LIM domain kinase 1
MGRGKDKEGEDRMLSSDEENTSSDDELMEAVMGLNGVHPGSSDLSNATAIPGMPR